MRAKRGQGVSNALVSKCYQPKYVECKSIWNGIEHHQSFQDETYSKLDTMFLPERSTSIVLADGIFMFRPEVWKNVHINKQCVLIDFEKVEVESANGLMAPLLQISVQDNPQVGIKWNLENENIISQHGSYYTSSPSRGATTVGQGAVDFLTASAIFAESIRNLFFDVEKNELSLEVLKRFVAYRRYYLANKHKLVSSDEQFLELVRKLSDSLYMSIKYMKRPGVFLKRGLETKLINEVTMPNDSNETEVWGKAQMEVVFDPDKLADVIKAF